MRRNESLSFDDVLSFEIDVYIHVYTIIKSQSAVRQISTDL